MPDGKERLFIKKIEISNCGRFFGTGHTIYLSDSAEKNITVIIGLSGRGKSTIHDLIYWCFYGEFKNTDQEQSKNVDYGLINIDALDNLSINESIIGSVMISLHNDKGEIYRITRELKATYNREESGTRKFEPLNNSRVSDGLDFEESVKLYMPDESGQPVQENNPKVVKNHITRSFPQALSDFFLFDGENLIKFRDQTSSSEFIRNGITKISGLSILDSIIKNSKYTANKIEDHLGGKHITSVPYKAEKDRLGSVIKDKEQILEGKKEKRDQINKHMQDILIRIGKNTKTAEIVKSLENTKNSLETAKRERNKNDDRIQEFLFDMLPQMMTRNTLETAESIFTRLEKEDKIPPSISSSAIEKILTSNPLRCVCGREFEKNNDASGPWQILSNMKDTIIQDDLSQAISLGRNLMSQMVDNTSPEKLKPQFNDLIATRRSKNNEIRAYNIEIEGYDASIQNAEYEEEDEDLPQLKTKFQTQVYDLTRDIQSLKDDIGQLNEQFDDNEQKLLNALEKEGKETDELNKIKLARAASKFAKDLEKKIEEEMRQLTQNATESYFLESAPEKETFAHVKISKNYDISVQDKKNFNSILSKGQAHVLGLSYVAGIREITNTKTFLIIDSPLHNISGHARNAISEAYSKYLPGVQIVLLVTDTEYLQGDPDGAEPVREILRKNGRVWKEYELGQKTTADGVETREIKGRNN